MTGPMVVMSPSALSSSLNFTLSLFSPSPLHQALSHFNTAHDCPIPSLQLVAIYDTALSFFDVDMLSLRPPVDDIVWDTAVAPCPLVHHGAVLLCRTLFISVHVCEAKQRNHSIGHDSCFVGMLAVSKLIRSHVVCRDV